jgi:hypothetical protein
VYFTAYGALSIVSVSYTHMRSRVVAEFSRMTKEDTMCISIEYNFKIRYKKRSFTALA